LLLNSDMIVRRSEVNARGPKADLCTTKEKEVLPRRCDDIHRDGLC
jgi:hypothetical protein